MWEKIKIMGLRMLSLKFFFTALYTNLGIVLMLYFMWKGLVATGPWGVWSGYMALGLGIYTTGNIKAKEFSAKTMKERIFKGV